MVTCDSNQHLNPFLEWKRYCTEPGKSMQSTKKHKKSVSLRDSPARNPRKAGRARRSNLLCVS